MIHHCINCNAPDVARAGDTFTCAKCGFTWDVAHEQANAAYLHSQGRAPAEPTGQPEPALTARSEGKADSSGDAVLRYLEALTSTALDDLAAAHHIDLTGARVKADKVTRLAESGALTVVRAPDGTLRVE